MHGNATVRNVYPGESQTETTVQTTVCNYSNLLLAEQRCHRSVGYKNSVSRFHMHVLSKTYELHRSLMNRTYHTQKGKQFKIYDPKYRIVTSTKYIDRIPQASFVVNFMYKDIIPGLIANNYACIKGKGVDNARKALKDILRETRMDDYCLCADLKGYFDSISHKALLDEMSQYLRDTWTAGYYTDVINSNDQQTGIDLGSEINQLSAVAFLNRLDHQLNNGSYVRYMDDIRFTGTKDECRQALKLIENECIRLRLRLSKNKTYIQPVKSPIRFLGFTFLKHHTGKITLKRIRSKLNNEKRKLRRMKESKVAFKQVLEHYRCVRTAMKKGNRSGVVKLDRYFNRLFRKELTEYADKKEQPDGKDQN